MGPGYEIQTFDRLGILGRRWYFRVADTGNHGVILTSEAYNRPGDRNETANQVSLATRWPVIPERKRR